MKSRHTRLDRFVSEHEHINRRDVRLLLAQGRLVVDGEPATSINQVIGQFTRVSLDERVLQSSEARYLMLNKPAGVVSATRDPRHQTVIDLLPTEVASDLHLVGRLDFNSTGLVLLTNDGRWSRSLSDPQEAIFKTYRVGLERPVGDDYVQAFAEGMYFPFEGITTRPAKLRILSDHETEVDLVEGRYHQIKRMFGRFDNPVTALHRMAIGSLGLDPELAAGEWRDLSLPELEALGVPHYFRGD